MDSLRDMFVGIHFNDDASKSLARVDRKLDGIEDSFRSIGVEVVGFGVVVGMMTTGLNRNMDSASKSMDDFKDHTKEAKDSVNGLDDEVKKVGNIGESLFSGMRGMATKFVSSAGMMVTGLSGVVAAGAPLTAAVGGLTASFAAAGIGAVGFAAVATPALKSVFDASEEVGKLEEKIAKADTAKARIKAQKELEALYENMSKSQRGALTNLQKFKSFWGDFQSSFEGSVFDSFGIGLQATQKALTQLKPTITSVAGVVNELMTEFNQSLDGDGMKNVFGWLETNAAESIRNFATAGGNTLSGLFGVLKSFAPIGASMEEGLVGLTAKFKEWGTSLENSQGFKNFIAYAKENGSKVMGIVSNIAEAGKNLVTDLAPFGSSVLSGVKSFTDLIVDNWGPIKETVIGLGTAVLTFNGIMMGLKVVSGINILMNAYKAGTLAATISQWGLNTAMLANPMTWVAIGIAGLVAGGVLLYRNWDTVREKTGQLWDKLGAFKGVATLVLGPLGQIIRAGITMADNWDNTKSVWDNVWNGIKISASNSVNDVIGSINGLIGTINKIPGISIPIIPKVDWGETKTRYVSTNVLKPKNPMQQQQLGLNKTLPSINGSHATGLASVPFDGYRAELHKYEAVLTAKQSNALRSAGILSSYSNGTPELNLDSSGSTSKNTTAQVANLKSSNGVIIKAPITINVHGGNTNNETAFSIKAEIEKFFGDLLIIDPQLMEG